MIEKLLGDPESDAQFSVGPGVRFVFDQFQNMNESIQFCFSHDSQ